MCVILVSFISVFIDTKHIDLNVCYLSANCLTLRKNACLILLGLLILFTIYGISAVPSDSLTHSVFINWADVFVCVVVHHPFVISFMNKNILYTFRSLIFECEFILNVRHSMFFPFYPQILHSNWDQHLVHSFNFNHIQNSIFIEGVEAINLNAFEWMTSCW